MVRYDTKLKLLATSLSALAGYVDAIGYLKLENFFVAFMSGNSTLLGIGLAQDRWNAAIAGAVIAIFVLGVVVGTFVGRIAGTRRQSTILLFISCLLVTASCLGALDAPRAAIACMALAMGAENTIFEREGEVSVGLTYMTGTLVKLGQHLAAAISGGDHRYWFWYLFLWLGLVVGACTGAVAYSRFGLSALWLAAAVAGSLTLIAAFNERADARRGHAR